MKHKNLVLTLGATITSALILLISCQKINDATSLGGGLIPPVDNINTFDTTLEVEVYNDLFTLLTDSTRSSYSAEQVLGYINDDPFFGKTDARMFFEIKPTTYPYTFQNLPDSVTLDSVVLVLENTGVYGDTNTAQTINVYELDQNNQFRADTNYLVRQNNLVYNNQIGSRTFLPSILNDSVRVFQDTTASQLRIRLDDAFGNRLLKYDTTTANNPYLSDSAFKTKFPGFAVIPEANGNALMKFDLTGANTKLAIYYRYKKLAVQDSAVVAYFSFKPYDTYTSNASACANYVIRDYSGTPLQAAVGGTTPDPEVFIQNAPGSFATIKIPGLASLSNRVVHRAELIMEQIYHPLDSTFPARNLLVDAYDPALSAYKLIPFDFTFDVSGNANLAAFGAAPINALNPSGQSIKVWKFNLTRYIQNVANKVEQPYDLRVLAPYYVNEKYKPTPAAAASNVSVTVNSTIAEGRVRLYGGDASQTNPQRMRLRIIYSKI